MEKFTTLRGTAAPLPMVNIDTDRIIPKQFLKSIKRSGFGKHLFAPMRYDADGNENPDFVLNQEPYREARILIAGENFGCGSSREHAPWALRDYGIRCIIAPSFADIFFNNCFKNALLPIVLDKGTVDKLLHDASSHTNTTITVDLDKQEIIRSGGNVVSFDVEPFRKHCLLNGFDDIGLTLQNEDKITTFEEVQRGAQPWLYAQGG